MFPIPLVSPRTQTYIYIYVCIRNPSKKLFFTVFLQWFMSKTRYIIYTFFAIKSVQNTSFCSVFNPLASKHFSKNGYLHFFFTFGRFSVEGSPKVCEQSPTICSPCPCVTLMWGRRSSAPVAGSSPPMLQLQSMAYCTDSKMQLLQRQFSYPKLHGWSIFMMFYPCLTWAV